MDNDDRKIVFTDKLPHSIDPTGTLLQSLKAEQRRLDPRSIVLLVISGLLLVFFLGNYALYAYARKYLPPRVSKKRPLSTKKLKKEKLKLGVSNPGE